MDLKFSNSKKIRLLNGFNDLAYSLQKDGAGANNFTDGFSI